MKKEAMILDVHTGEILFFSFDGKEIIDWLNTHGAVVCPNKRLYENYGFTEDNDSNIWVVSYR